MPDITNCKWADLMSSLLDINCIYSKARILAQIRILRTEKVFLVMCSLHHAFRGMDTSLQLPGFYEWNNVKILPSVFCNTNPLQGTMKVQKAVFLAQVVSGSD